MAIPPLAGRQDPDLPLPAGTVSRSGTVPCKMPHLCTQKTAAFATKPLLVHTADSGWRWTRYRRASTRWGPDSCNNWWGPWRWWRLGSHHVQSGRLGPNCTSSGKEPPTGGTCNWGSGTHCRTSLGRHTATHRVDLLGKGHDVLEGSREAKTDILPDVSFQALLIQGPSFRRGGIVDCKGQLTEHHGVCLHTCCLLQSIQLMTRSLFPRRYE